jgi:hypothetical protein
VRILGYCRFSYFGISDTGRAIATEADAERLLYAPDRLAARFHLFEHLAAPSVRAQTDPDFRFVVVTSELLPAPYLRRLERIVAAVPQMELLVTETRGLSQVLTPVIRAAAAAEPDGRTLNFRLDDDDALAVDYVARLRAAGAPLEPPALISFPRGVLLFASDGQSRTGEIYKDYVAIGLARLNAREDGRDPFRIQHRLEPTRTPSYVDPRGIAYLYGTHPFNNTGVGNAESALIQRYLRNHPDLIAAVTTEGLDERIAAAFPFLTGISLRAVHARTGTASFDPDAPLPESLLS